MTDKKDIKINENNNDLSLERRTIYRNRLSNDELNEIKKYMECLNDIKAIPYSIWKCIGLYLHIIDDRLISIFRDFTKNNNNGADYNCANFWYICNNERYNKIDNINIDTIKSLAYYYNKIRYYNIFKDDFINPSNSAKLLQSYDIAEIIYNVFKPFHIYVDILDIWFYYNFKSHKWEPDIKGYKLRQYISTDVYNRFKELSDYHSEQSLESGDYHWIKCENIRSVMNKLKDTGFKENIMIELRMLFNIMNTNLKDKMIEYIIYHKIDDKYTKCMPYNYMLIGDLLSYIMNNNDDLLCFQDGVFVKSLQLIRPGLSTDYISKQFNFSFNDFIIKYKKPDIVIDKLYELVKNDINIYDKSYNIIINEINME